jgi:hypothetical protein
MLFQHTLKLVLSEQKKQTRRIIKPDEIAVRGRNNQIQAVIVNGRAKWRIDKIYAVQPSRGKEQVARIRLVAINSEKVMHISTQDAKAEGLANRQEFLRLWRKIHGEDSLNLRVWVLKFELVDIQLEAAEFVSTKPPPSRLPLEVMATTCSLTI